MKRILLSIFLLPLALSAQVQMNGPGSCTQDFNTLASSGPVNPWVNNSTIPNWFSQRTSTGTNYNTGTGTLATGDMYSFGSTSSPDRALGCIGSNNAATGGSFAHGILLQNTGTSTISNFNLTYALEQWRNGGSNTAQSVTVWFQVSSSAISSLTPSVTTGWTSVSALTGSSPISSITAGALDGNAVANRAVVSGGVPASVPPGSYIMIKWEDPDHAGNDDGFGLDDVSLTWASCNASYGTDVQTVCDSLTWIDGNVYYSTVSGITHNLVNAAGCDSIVTLDLTVNYTQGQFVLEQACAFPYTSVNTGQTYDTAGVYVTNGLTPQGCPIKDSVIIEFVPHQFDTYINTSADNLTLLSADTNLMFGYQWYDCTTGQNIPGATFYAYDPTANGSYALIGQWPNNCVDTSDCFTVMGVGLNELINNEFVIYPNPSHGAFELMLPSVSVPTIIELFNLNGQKVYSKELVGTSHIVELPHISKGTYLVKARTDEESYTKRIVIE